MGTLISSRRSPGPGPARNLGATRAAGCDSLPFWDADCQPDPHFARAAPRNACSGTSIRSWRMFAIRVWGGLQDGRPRTAYQVIFCLPNGPATSRVQGLRGQGILIVCIARCFTAAGRSRGLPAFARIADWGQRPQAAGHRMALRPE